MQALRASTTSSGETRSALAGLLGIVAAPVGRLFGTSGRLAAMNVKRNPRRVLSTAMSMIVGLTLISGMSVVAASYRTTLSEAMTSDFDADLILTGVDGGSFPFAAMESLAAVPGVEAASGFGSAEVRVQDQVIDAGSFQSASANGVLDVGVTAGALSAAADQVAVSSDFAQANQVAVGDVLAVEFSDGATTRMAVSAVFDDDSVITSELLMDEGVVAAHARNVDATLGALRFDASTDAAAAQSAVDAALAAFPQMEAQTVEQFLESRQTQVDQLLMLANGLLGLTIVIAMSGIANTVALSVLERTNEIGLLRSVGMSRRQVRSMIRHEALITSAVGALLGVGLGVAIAAIGTTLLPENFVNTLVLPGTQLVTYVVVGVALGMVAAFIPALRASRLNVVAASSAN